MAEGIELSSEVLYCSIYLCCTRNNMHDVILMVVICMCCSPVRINNEYGWESYDGFLLCMCLLTQVWPLLFTGGRKLDVCVCYGVCVSKSDSEESS